MANEITEQTLRTIIRDEIQLAFSSSIARLNDAAKQIEKQLQTCQDYQQYLQEKINTDYHAQLQQMIREQIQIMYNPIFDRLNRPKVTKDPDRTITDWMKIIDDFGQDGNKLRIMKKYNVKKNTLNTKLSNFWLRMNGFQQIPPNHIADRFKGNVQNKTKYRGRQLSIHPNPIGSI